MNRNQWFVLGIGSILLSVNLFNMMDSILEKYAFFIPSIIFQFVGWSFVVCGFLEPKKKD